jgi:hypothetical protein
MKELTIKEKAKAYDEASKWVEGIYPTLTHEQQGEAEAFFPMLKESEDERVRKEIYSALKYLETELGWDAVGDVDILDAYAWLENQGKQETLCDKCRKERPSHSCQDITELGRCTIEHIQSQTDKAEPKFKVGDKIRRKNPSSFDKDMQVARIEKDYYICNHIGKFSSEVVPFSKESSYEIIGQKPVEWRQENREELTEFENAMMHIGGSFFGENAGLDPNDTAMIKEQAKLLLELAPKTEWSEEDKNFMYDTLSNLTELKDRYGEGYGNVGKCIDWLKSLKQRYTWKPSDEEIDALEEAMYQVGILSPLGSKINDLYEDLKKLKEE